jgi:uncharacterized protein
MMPGPVLDLSSFADALRRRGLVVTPDQTADMARSLLLVDLADHNQVYAALRALAITDPSHRTPYDEEFQRFFGGWRMPRIAEQHSSNLGQGTATVPILAPLESRQAGEISEQAGASAVEAIGDRDFADLDEDGLAEAKRLVMTMLWEPTDVRTRRWQPDRHGRRPDMRRTLHSAVGPAGDMMSIRFRERRNRQRPLIIIADISGSMERYADLFLVFSHAAQRRLRQVEIFTFSTKLTRITEPMSKRDTKSALAGVNEAVTDWSGGTQIGDAFAEWNHEWSRRLGRGGPVVLVLSDGWDCGEPDLLATETARLSRSVHKLIWLNPLASRPNYEPATRGMRAVLPYVDHLLPAASVNDLRSVVRLLESISGVRRA